MAGEFDLLAASKRIQRSTLRPMERYIARCILDFWSRDSPTPWPSETELAEWSGFSKNAVIKAIKGLVAAGAVRIECKRPMRIVNGRLEVMRNAKPTNHYSLSGLMSLPVREKYQCTTDTSAGDAPVHEGTFTSARGAPEPVHEVVTKEPRNKPKKEPTNVEFVLEPPSSPTKDPVEEVFAYWAKELWSKHHERKPKITKERRAPISGRLRDGYTVADLKRVIDVVAKSAWHNGENDRGHVYIEPETILAPKKIDRWLAAKPPTHKTKGSPPMQDDGVDVLAKWGRRFECPTTPTSEA